MLQALRKGQLREHGSLGAFVHGTTRNLLSDHRRATARRGEVPLADLDTPAATSNGLDSDDRSRIVRRALQRLDPKDREILLLLLVEGLSPAAIGERLALNAEAVRQRKSRAIKRIRVAIAKKSESQRW